MFLSSFNFINVSILYLKDHRKLALCKCIVLPLPAMLYPYAAYAAVIPACAPASSAALRDFLTPPRPRERRGTPVEPLGRPRFPDPLLLVGVTKMRDDYPAN